MQGIVHGAERRLSFFTTSAMRRPSKGTLLYSHLGLHRAATHHLGRVKAELKAIDVAEKYIPFVRQVASDIANVAMMELAKLMQLQIDYHSKRLYADPQALSAIKAKYRALHQHLKQCFQTIAEGPHICDARLVQSILQPSLSQGSCQQYSTLPFHRHYHVNEYDVACFVVHEFASHADNFSFNDIVGGLPQLIAQHEEIATAFQKTLINDDHFASISAVDPSHRCTIV